MIRWLHLSDMHFAYANHINRNIRDSLIEYLDKLKLKIDAIFITGDIAYKAQYSEDLKPYLERLSKVTNCDMENIFICVGNHDIERDEIRNSIVEIVCKNYIESEDLSEKDYKRLFFHGHELFNNKMKELLPNYLPQVHYFIERKEYTVTVLNTCLFSYGNDKNNLYILDNKFYNILTNNKEQRKSDKINFAIGHHSQEWLNSAQRERFGLQLEKNKVDLYLCGHNHGFGMKELDDCDIRQFTAGSILEKNNDEVCFLLGKFNPEQLEYNMEIHTNDSKFDNWHLECRYNKFRNGVYTEKLNRKNTNNQITSPKERNTDYTSSVPYNSTILHIKEKAKEFIGYEKELEEAKKQIKYILNEKDSGEFLFYHARELYGKSYFCAKLANDLGQVANKLDLIEQGIIFVNGKAANDISMTIELIRIQASEILGYKIEFADWFRNNEEGYLALTEEKKIEQILFELSKNNKKTLVIIDALNEINAKEAQFLPQFLPRGICLFVTSNSDNKVFNNRTELKGFKEKEIREILKCNDIKFIRDVLKRTKGCPMLIFDVKESLLEAKGNIKNVTIQVSGKDYFNKKVAEWRGNQILSNLLELFSVFGYVSSLTVDQLQAYLNDNIETKEVTSQQILEALNLVQSQLLITSENGKNIYKAYYSLFIDQINNEISEKDVAQKVESIMRCMLNNQDVFKAEIMMKFFVYWSMEIKDGRALFLLEILNTLESLEKYEELEEIAIRVMLSKKTIKNYVLEYYDSKCNVINREGVYRVLYYIYANKESQYCSKDKYIKLLEFLINEKKYAWAKGALSLELFIDKELKNKEEAERLLREAAEEGDLFAKGNLGDRMLDGDNIKQNKEEGEKLLREAAEEGFTQAKLDLASRMLDGANIKQNKEEGEKLLREVAEKGNLVAKGNLGSRLLDGKNIKQNKKEGEKLLKEAAEKGNLVAKADLATRLLDGANIKQNKKKGEKLLKEAAEKDNLVAKGHLGTRFLDGKNIKQNKKEGERLLREAAERGNFSAKADLAARLLNGDNIKQNKEEGEKLLREAAEEGSIQAKGELGSRLLDGYNIKQNKAEGEKLLREVAEEGYIQAKGELGSRLLDGYNIKQNKAEGERLLKEAAEEGYIRAKNTLGSRLLDGNNIKQDKTEGEKLLREAAEEGNIDAKINLGSRLLDGDNIKQNKAEGERLLRETAGLGDVASMCRLGFYLYNENNVKDAMKFIYMAIEKDNEIDGTNLAYIMRKEGFTTYKGYTIESILSKQVFKEKPKIISTINYALFKIEKSENSEDWRNANNLLEKLKVYKEDEFKEAIGWWNDNLSKKGDAEGDLVIGWLCKLGLIGEIDGLSYLDRFNKVLDGGGFVINWLYNE